jgi:hypothetical protein
MSKMFSAISPALTPTSRGGGGRRRRRRRRDDTNGTGGTNNGTNTRTGRRS